MVDGAIAFSPACTAAGAALNASVVLADEWVETVEVCRRTAAVLIKTGLPESRRRSSRPSTEGRPETRFASNFSNSLRNICHLDGSTTTSGEPSIPYPHSNIHGSAEASPSVLLHRCAKIFREIGGFIRKPFPNQNFITTWKQKSGARMSAASLDPFQPKR